MCGFVTLITPNKNFPEKVLVSMRDRLVHRGPDDCGSLIEDVGTSLLAMGHRRLSILDLSPLGRQPMQDVTERYVIAYNGEIYNYIELKKELQSCGRIFKNDCDTEVLLNAFAQWGEECLLRLNGMFAFSIWDRKEKVLFVARDRLGEKPLYYTSLKSGGIAMASEAKALFAHPDISAEANDAVVNSFLQGQTSYVDENTFFTGIKRLPPAHAMLIDAQGNIQKKWRYWLPDYNRELPRQNEKDLIAEFKHRLQKSIKMRLRSDVGAGMCLSGGLDSSLITGMVKDLHDQGEVDLGRTYSARFDNDPTLSEGQYIDSMVEYKGLSPSFISPDPKQIIDDSALLHWHQEQPFLSASMYLEWCVVKRAKETGTKVLLHGQGSDEFLCGYQHHMVMHQLDQLDNGQWGALFLNTFLFNRRIQKEAKKYDAAERRINKDIAWGFPEIFVNFLKMTKHFLLRYQAIRPNFDLAGLPTNQQKHILKTALAMGVLYDMLANNLHSADCNGMAHSVETRFPYLDYELIDWCISLPIDMLVKLGWQKYILRKAAKGIIPEDIRWRVDKVGFAAPQDVWLRGPLKDWAHSMLFAGPIKNMAGYDKQFLEKKWSAHQSGESDVSWALWRWISMNQWLMLTQSGAWKNDLKN